jgi:hypothetical protein
MTTTRKPRPKAAPTPFEKMRELTRRLVAVPKHETKPRQTKKGHRKRGR